MYKSRLKHTHMISIYIYILAHPGICHDAQVLRCPARQWSLPSWQLRCRGQWCQPRMRRRQQHPDLAGKLTGNHRKPLNWSLNWLGETMKNMWFPVNWSSHSVQMSLCWAGFLRRTILSARFKTISRRGPPGSWICPVNLMPMWPIRTSEQLVLLALLGNIQLPNQ